MGRIGTDVLALACIAGGALAGAAVTAGVMSRDADTQYRVVTRHCAGAEAPRIVVRLHGDDSGSTVTTRSYSAQAGSADAPCATGSSIAVIRTTEWTEEIGQRLDAARIQVEEVRLEADEMRLRADELRVEAEEFAIQADEIRFGEDHEAALDALNELLAQMKGSDASAEELRAAMERVRDLTLTRRGTPVVRIVGFGPPPAPEAPDAPAAAPAPPAPAPAAPGSGGN